ncbi:MAG: DNA-directed RNA polymerase subunit alpha C-terminal domain-containing protein, partial [Patescibacteria group bacterium]|nr:DNA-directed RNA polymerase subunit alpha C-terminal domain-containing protein [Patescibacteria group bacterium]
AEAGRLPVDASFGPIERVMFNIDETRKGKKMDLDMVTLTVFTDGSINPADAVGDSCDTLCSVFGKLMLLARQESSSGKTSSAKKVTSGTASESTEESALSEEVKKWAIEDLKISKRVKASLASAGMKIVEDLVGKSSKELLEIPGFGEKALSEVVDFLKEYSLAE